MLHGNARADMAGHHLKGVMSAHRPNGVSQKYSGIISQHPVKRRTHSFEQARASRKLWRTFRNQLLHNMHEGLLTKPRQIGKRGL